MLNLVTGMMSDIIERIVTKNTIMHSTNRSQEVLNAFTKIMTMRKHVDLDVAVCNTFNGLFGFERVGILFVDGVEGDPLSPNLFKINHLTKPDFGQDHTEYEKSKGFSGIVRFPKNIGITGESI